MDNSSMALAAEEQRLTKIAEEYQGLGNIRDILMAQAAEDGYEGVDAEAVVDHALGRLNKVGKKGAKGQKLGIGHDPYKQYVSLVNSIRSLKY